jgi:hypothetical protein
MPFRHFFARPAMGKAETKIAERYAELTGRHSIGT